MKSELLESLKQDIENNLVCELKDAATNMVFGKGNSDAKLFFIGEAPGEKEDLQGIPFVGRAGKELDKGLHSIGLSLDDVYIANILKYRPPKNRNPKAAEIANHTPYLIKQIEIISPKFIVPMGNYAMKFILGGFTVKGMKTVQGIAQLHGKVHEVLVNAHTVQVFPLYHPAAMLYNPRLREEFASDFLRLKNLLGIK